MRQYPLHFTERLKVHEGFNATIKPCSTGHPTIGYGTNLDAIHVPGINADTVLNKDQGERLMVAECLAKEKELAKLAPWTSELDNVRFLTILNMAYNIGVGGVLGFKRMIAAIRAGQYDEAAREMHDSDWAKQVGDYAPDSAKGRENGRPGRVWELAYQMRTGQWWQGGA